MDEMETAPDRDLRLRLKLIAAYREIKDAGAVCRRFGISRPTLRKWLRRYETEGEAGLRSQSRRPHRSPMTKVEAAEEAMILVMRQKRRLGSSGCATSCGAWHWQAPD